MVRVSERIAARRRIGSGPTDDAGEPTHHITSERPRPPALIAEKTSSSPEHEHTMLTVWHSSHDAQMLSAVCRRGSREMAVTERASTGGLMALPDALLHRIVARLPGRDAARAMGACRALAAAVRSMPEWQLSFEVDNLLLPNLSTYQPGGPAWQTRPRAGAVARLAAAVASQHIAASDTAGGRVAYV